MRGARNEVGQPRRQSLAICAKPDELVQRRMAEVGIDHQDTGASLADNDAEVEQRGCFPLVGSCAGYQDRLNGPTGAAETEVGPQIAVGFGEPSVQGLSG